MGRRAGPRSEIPARNPANLGSQLRALSDNARLCCANPRRLPSLHVPARERPSPANVIHAIAIVPRWRPVRPICEAVSRIPRVSDLEEHDSLVDAIDHFHVVETDSPAGSPVSSSCEEGSRFALQAGPTGIEAQVGRPRVHDRDAPYDHARDCPTPSCSAFIEVLQDAVISSTACPSANVAAPDKVDDHAYEQYRGDREPRCQATWEDSLPTEDEWDPRVLQDRDHREEHYPAQAANAVRAIRREHSCQSAHDRGLRSSRIVVALGILRVERLTTLRTDRIGQAAQEVAAVVALRGVGNLHCHHNPGLG